jgi:hypothetical protein
MTSVTCCRQSAAAPSERCGTACGLVGYPILLLLLLLLLLIAAMRQPWHYRCEA